jgi:hypothetical protein
LRLSVPEHFRDDAASYADHWGAGLFNVVHLRVRGVRHLRELNRSSTRVASIVEREQTQVIVGVAD